MRQLTKNLCHVVFCLTALATPLCAAESNAVQLDVLQGQILVDQGQGFGLARVGMELNTGDRLMLLKNAAGILSSAETGCVLALRQPGAFVVPDLSQCEAGKAAVLASSVIIEPANGVYEPVVLAPPPPPVGVPGIAPLVAGGAFVASVAGAFVVSQLVEDDKPKSVSAP